MNKQCLNIIYIYMSLRNPFTSFIKTRKNPVVENAVVKNHVVENPLVKSNTQNPFNEYIRQTEQRNDLYYHPSKLIQTKIKNNSNKSKKVYKSKIDNQLNEYIRQKEQRNYFESKLRNKTRKELLQNIENKAENIKKMYKKIPKTRKVYTPKSRPNPSIKKSTTETPTKKPKPRPKPSIRKASVAS